MARVVFRDARIYLIQWLTKIRHTLNQRQSLNTDKEHLRKIARGMFWLMLLIISAKMAYSLWRYFSFSAEYTGIRETIGQAVSGVYAQAEDKNITIMVEAFEDRKLYHNPKWTAEALENILDNAVKYSPSGSTVTVRVYPMELYTQIEITDQGIGIPKGEYNKILQRFYRSGNAAQTQGSGLGLYLAQLILNNEKGYVTAVSRPGEGSSFRVFLLNEVLTVL